MKTNYLHQLCSLLLLLSVVFTSSTTQAQDMKPIKTTYPDTLSTFYIGARGGYLFKNDLATDPAYFLNSGYFGELNLGWRSHNTWFGWNLSAGRLHLDRKIPFSGNAGYALKASDVMRNTSQSWLWDKTAKDDRTFDFGPKTLDTSAVADLGSWYAMTGPEFWFGTGPFQVFLSLNVGVGMTEFGYYYYKGSGEATNTLEYDYTSKGGGVAGPVTINRVSAMYEQYGMTKETFGTLPNLKDDAQFHLMARGTVGFDYFISPQFSINASASYWYIMPPDWAAARNTRGQYTFNGHGEEYTRLPEDKTDPFLHPNTGKGKWVVEGADEFSEQTSFATKNLGYLSANIGIRFWLDKKPEPKKLVEESPVVAPAPEPEVQEKNLLITAKDKPTGFALSNVKVTVYKNGKEFYTGLTDVNGALPVIDDIEPGNYSIQGILNGIKTDITRVDSSDFLGDARVISRTLLHNDLRFTIVGHTLHAESNKAVPQVKTTLTNETNGINSFQTSNAEGAFRFQLKQNADFTVFAEHKGYFSNREKVSTKGLDRSKTLYVNLRLGLNELKQGATFQLKNIYYDFDKANIRPDAARVLDDLYKVMVDNPTLVIELSSHTDSRGADTYNMKLSQRRAESAVSYLVNKGIDPDRMVAKGYGESQPVNGCVDGVPCTDDQYQANRRTEIKVLKK